MPDATYVGAGMPCGNCGNPLTPGQPHKCGRVGNPYAPSADWKPGQDTFTAQAAGIWQEGFAAGRAAATQGPPDHKPAIGLLRAAAVQREIAANHNHPVEMTVLMASWEGLRLAADLLEREAGMVHRCDPVPASPDPPPCRCPDDWRYDDGSVFCPRHQTKPDAPAASPDPPDDEHPYPPADPRMDDVGRALISSLRYCAPEMVDEHVAAALFAAQRIGFTAGQNLAKRNGVSASSPDERLREAGETLLDAYDAWADDRSDGEFALWSYDAIHNGVAALRAALAAADREKPQRNHAPWCEGGHGDTPCPAPPVSDEPKEKP